MLDNFVDTLKNNEKISIVRALLYLIKVDEKVDDVELERMKEIMELYGMTEQSAVLEVMMTEDSILGELKNNITERSKALFLIRELLVLANIDDNLDKTETDFIEKVAKVLNIEDEKVLAINNLVLSRKLWLFSESVIMESNGDK